jgi:hypothetical protein
MGLSGMMTSTPPCEGAVFWYRKNLRLMWRGATPKLNCRQWENRCAFAAIQAIIFVINVTGFK